MAKTKRRRKTTRRAPVRRAPARQIERREPLMSEETAQALTGVGLTLAGLIILLALFGIGGPLGDAVVNWVGQLVGWLTWLLAFALLFFGVSLLWREENPRREPIGAIFVIVGLAGLAHLTISSDALKAAHDGRGGGLVGYSLYVTLKYALGTFGSFLVFLAVVVVGALIALNRPLRRRREEKSEDEMPTASEVAAAVRKVIRPKPSSVPSPTPADVKKQAAAEPDFVPRVVDTAWERPPLSLLSQQSTAATAGDTKRGATIITQTLANFGIDGEVVSVNVGPTVTQYEFRPEAGVKVAQINTLNNDLALALAAHPIRIEAPIPGKSTVGIEAPNAKGAVVRLAQLFTSDAWKRGGTLPLALGLDVAGKPVVTDLATMPHLLIAGATGSGKSVGINALLASLLYTHSPKHVRLLLVDPKRVELTNYNDIPHLLAPVIVDAPKVINALKWLTMEMDRRYKLFQDESVRNLVEYNKGHKDDELPYIVVVIDELADLMIVSGKAVEAAIVRIAQLARATGIHLVLATQRPSVDVITGLIKANFPSRIAFTTTSVTDSRTILDQGGAEKLLGKGDMLFMTSSSPKPIRIQSAFMELKEVKSVTDFLKGKGAPIYDESVTESSSPGGGEGSYSGGAEDDPLYEEARAEVIRTRKASASYLQRRLKVGYARAARLLDLLEENGVIGPGEGAKAREILVDDDSF